MLLCEKQTSITVETVYTGEEIKAIATKHSQMQSKWTGKKIEKILFIHLLVTVIFGIINLKDIKFR